MQAPAPPIAPTTRSTHQRGMTLLLGLILLTVITILSLAGMRGIGTQERMSRNLRDRNMAFQAAESALRAAETALHQNLISGSPMVPGAGDLAYWEQCWESESAGCPALITLPINLAEWGVAERPSYRIERLAASNYGSILADEALASAPLHRITARGVGGTAQAVVILQTTFMP